MNKLKRTLALVATLALATTAFAGCDKDEDSSSKAASKSESSSKSDSTAASKEESSKEEKAENTVPNTGDKMTILCWTGDDINPMMKNFTENTDYKAEQIKWNQVGKNGGDAAEKYASYFAGDEDVDLFIAEADWILNYINKDDYSAPLSKLGLTKNDFKTNYAYTQTIGTDSNGVLKGASWQATPGGYVYRTSLADKYLGVKSADEMQAKVADWDKFLATAEELSTKTDGKVALTCTIGGMWQVFSYNRTQAWVDSSNKLVVDDSCGKFMDICKTMYDKGYVTKETQWTDTWYNPGQDGKTLGYFFCTWCLGEGSMLSNASGKEGSESYGDWTLVKGPNEYAWGGSWLCLSPKADNGEICEAFVKYFCSNEETMKKYALAKGEFVNSKNVMQSIVDDKSNKNKLLGGQDQFTVLIDSADKINMEGTVTPYDSTIKTDYMDAVDKYLKGTHKDQATAINAFKDKVAADLPDLTVE